MMSTRADHEAFQAAQALCMLANTNRQERVDGDETEDEDCVITHVRPVVHRHHPYRRPGPPQEARVPATRPGASLNNAQPPRRVQQQSYPVRQPLQQRPSPPLPPPPPAQQQWTLPRPLPAMSQLAVRHLLPLQVPVVTREPTAVQPSPPARQLTPEQRPLADRKPLPDGLPLSPVPQPPPARQSARDAAPIPDARPSPPERLHIDDGSDPLEVYTSRSLALQALVAAEEGEWMRSSDIVSHLTDKYPFFRKDAARLYLSNILFSALRGNYRIMETKKYTEDIRDRRNVYRVAAGAREAATRLAWRPRRPRRGTGAGDRC